MPMCHLAFLMQNDHFLLPPPHTATEAVMGMFLTMAGITLCVISSIDEQDPRQQNATQFIH